jgi:hypothetical protein
MVNPYARLVCPGAPLMPEIATDPPASSCNRLHPRPRFQESQSLGPDLLSPRARALREGKLRQSAGPAARHSQSQAARARSGGPAAERAGAVGSPRPQAASVAGPRRATLAAAARCHRPGGASRDRPVLVADVRGSSSGAIHRAGGRCAWRHLARRGRAYRRAGGCPVRVSPASLLSCLVPASPA